MLDRIVDDDALAWSIDDTDRSFQQQILDIHEGTGTR